MGGTESAHSIPDPLIESRQTNGYAGVNQLPDAAREVTVGVEVIFLDTERAVIPVQITHAIVFNPMAKDQSSPRPGERMGSAWTNPRREMAAFKVAGRNRDCDIARARNCWRSTILRDYYRGRPNARCKR